MHDVKIDEEGIAAFFDAKASGIEPAAATGSTGAPVPQQTNPAEAWKPVTVLVASVLANKVCPAWEVSAEVQGQWAEALGECLDQVMPGGLGNIEAWGPWGKLAFASGLWLFAGFDPATMTLKPRYPVDPDQDAPPAIDPPGGFKTDA